MTKCVHISTVHPTSDIRVVRKECQALADAGYEVVMILPNSTATAQRANPRLVAFYGARNRLDRFVRCAFVVFVRALREGDAIIHIQHCPELLPWGQLLRFLGREVVYDMHENVPKAILSKQWIPWILRKPVAALYHVAEALLLRGMYVIFAEDSYVQYYPRVHSYTILHNFPILGVLVHAEAQEPAVPTLGYVGGVSPARGIVTVFEALATLEEQGCRVNMECIGPIPRECRDEICEHRVVREGLVKLHGYKEPEQAWELLAKCTMGVALLKELPNYYESYPTKIFEYMALRKPVIASRFPLYQGVIEKHQCGLCVDPDSIEETAWAIRWLAEHPLQAGAMGQRGWHAAQEEYGWERESEQLLALYERILF